MSEEQLKVSLAKAKGDIPLQAMLKVAKSSEEVVSLAKDYGCKFTSDKLS